MIEYPDCDLGNNCWYSYNSSRLCQFTELYHLISSKTSYKLDCNRVVIHPPSTITLCDICIHNDITRDAYSKTCHLCEGLMLDPWVKYKSNDYCRYCVDDDSLLESITDNHDYNIKKHKNNDSNDSKRKLMKFVDMTHRHEIKPVIDHQSILEWSNYAV